MKDEWWQLAPWAKLIRFLDCLPPGNYGDFEVRQYCEGGKYLIFQGERVQWYVSDSLLEKFMDKYRDKLETLVALTKTA